MIEIEVEKQLGAFTIDAAFSSDGGVTALFGPSGAGKSTLVKLVAGLLRPDKGRIRINGEVVLDIASGVARPPRERKVGVVFQDGRLFPHMSVKDNLSYGFKRTARERPVDFETVVGTLGLAPFLGRRPGSLSGGERQRVAIGRALLAQPRLLLMDEPLASLDTAIKTQVLPYLERLGGAFQIPILYVTHDAAEVLRLASDLVLLREGRVVGFGPLDAMTSRTDLPPEAEALGAGTILKGIVAENDAARGLTRLETAAGPLFLPLAARPPGSAISLRIAARDVAIALERPREISVQNILPVVIAEMRPAAGYQMRLKLNAGNASFIAEITEEAAKRLALAPGLAAYALIKAVALARADAP